MINLPARSVQRQPREYQAASDFPNENLGVTEDVERHQVRECCSTHGRSSLKATDIKGKGARVERVI